ARGDQRGICRAALGPGRARCRGVLMTQRTSRPGTALPGRDERWPGSPRGRSPFARSKLGAMSGPPTSMGRIVYAAAMAHVLHPPYYEKNVVPDGKPMGAELTAVVRDM